MSIHTDLATWVSANPEQAIGLIVSLAGSARYYRNTGSVSLRRLPWRLIRRLGHTLRAAFFTVNRPNHPTINTTASVETLIDVLGRESYAPNWEFSYRYNGEDANLSRVEYAPQDGLRWFQTHVRIFDDGEHRTIMAHWEPEPTEHPRAHLAERHMDYGRGLDTVEQVLNQAGVPYARDA